MKKRLINFAKTANSLDFVTYMKIYIQGIVIFYLLLVVLSTVDNARVHVIYFDNVSFLNPRRNFINKSLNSRVELIFFYLVN